MGYTIFNPVISVKIRFEIVVGNPVLNFIPKGKLHELTLEMDEEVDRRF